MKRSTWSVVLSAVLGLTLPVLSPAAEDGVTAGSTAVNTAATASATETELNAQTQQMDGLATSQGQKSVSRKIAADFEGLSGSRENADALAAGLRNGTEISLTGADGAATRFTPATGHMGNGNVYKSLALAKQQLAGAGITDPTPEQIQAALNGGTVTAPDGTRHELQGVLQMRSEGMGWGRIAKAQGTSLGKVVSAMKSANASLKNPKAQQAASETAVTTVESSTSKTAKPNKAGESRIVNAAGDTQVADKHAAQSRATSAGKSHTDSRNRIVTAAGAPAGGVPVKSQHSGAGSAPQMTNYAKNGGGNGNGGGQGHFK